MKVSIIGKGNVGSHLLKAFGSGEVNVSLIESRDLSILSNDNDILILTVRDNAISEVAASVSVILPDFAGTVIHTAGSVSMEILKPFFKSYGVFYPLQTFSKNLQIQDYRSIPLFIEASDLMAQERITRLANSFSDHIFFYSSERRRDLHLASVFACNFVNAMYSVAEEILREKDIPFEVLHPLMRTTLSKALQTSPEQCQTGPAKRGDSEVMNEQLKALEGELSHKRIYEAVSSYIKHKFNE